MSPRGYFLSFEALFPAPFPAPSLSLCLCLSLSLSIFVSHTHTHRHHSALETATCDYRCPFLAQLDCAWNCGDEPAADWRVSRYFGAGNKKVLCWETQQVRLCGFIFSRSTFVARSTLLSCSLGIYGALSLRPKHMLSEYFTISSPPSISRKSADLLHLLTSCATNYP